MAHPAARFLIFPCLLSAALTAAPVAMAQNGLPTVEVMAARVSDLATRDEALLQLAALARFEQRLLDGEGGLSADALIQDVAWLDRLQARYGRALPRGPGLDPAAWWVYLKLREQRLPVDALVLPAGPGLDIYLSQVFAREDERMAAALLPELLWRLEAESTLRWSSLRERAVADEGLSAALSEALGAWQADAAAAPNRDAAGAGNVGAALTRMAAEAIATGPPDPRLPQTVRYQLLLAMPGRDAAGRRDAMAYLQLAGLLEGLRDQRYTAFAAGLLSVAGGLLLDTTDGVSPVAGWLFEHLPEVSAALARDFARIDPGINSAVAAVFDVAQALGAADVDAGQPERQVADSVARLTMLGPDIGYYYGLPVRDAIAGSVDACADMLAGDADESRSPGSREGFDDCLEGLVSLAESESRAPSLAGDPGGPFGAVELQRELSVTPVQRINYALGYLHERYSTACSMPGRALPNALEWSTLATLMAALAESSPVYFQTPENEARLARMRRVGAELLEVTAGQVDCFAGSGASVNDPVSRSLIDYRAQLSGFSGALRDAIQEFRDRELAPGADVALAAGSGQSTAYRPDDLMVGPCDPQQVCEMDGEISSTRALLGLFPETFLLADQSGMGEVQLCYDRMEWVDRRSEQVRPDDTNVANYFGRFGFELRGRFLTGGDAFDVFAFRFTSPDEYHYLFAAASEEVLQDSCPMEWIGSRIVTPMRESRRGIVPNRLTYLAAPRTLPSRLLSLNWDRGAEWRDWFITGIGVTETGPAAPPDIGPALTEHLEQLARRERGSVYATLLSGGAGAGPAMDLSGLSSGKALIRMLITLFYGEALLESDPIRSAVAGQAGLLDQAVLERFRRDGVPIDTVVETGLRRLEGLESEWRQQPEARLRMGSVDGGVAHGLMRLDELYRHHFAPPAVAAPATASPGNDDG